MSKCSIYSIHYKTYTHIIYVGKYMSGANLLMKDLLSLKVNCPLYAFFFLFISGDGRFYPRDLLIYKDRKQLAF